MSKSLLVGTRKGLFMFERNGTVDDTWTIAHTEFVGVPVVMVLHDPRDGAYYAGLGHGQFGVKLHRSDDGGRTWTQVENPAFPEKPDDAPVVNCPMRGTEIPWDVKMLWSLEIDPAQDGGLWCGTIPGGLFHSSDRGQSWELNHALWNKPERAKWFGGGYDYPGIHSICVDPRDPATIHCGISCGGVWRTTDAGHSWSQQAHGMIADYLPPEQASDPESQDPHIVVQCKGQPDKMWTQHHNGIFRTTDGSESWSEVKDVVPSNFGFACAVHPEDGDTAWFVPAVKDEVRVPVEGNVVVTRTRDGGQIFETLSKGLPQRHAYDIVYRHCLDIDSTGNELAFGSTTGSLWYSPDQGDSWQTLSNHLPPVYVTRFI